MRETRSLAGEKVSGTEKDSSHLEDRARGYIYRRGGMVRYPVLSRQYRLTMGQRAVCVMPALRTTEAGRAARIVKPSQSSPDIVSWNVGAKSLF